MRKKASVKERALNYLDAHNKLACILVGMASAAALVGLFAFVVFSGFGASAEFIYNQF